MYTGKRYQLRQVLVWTWRETLFMTAVAVVPVVLSAGFGWRWLDVPWVPIAMLGTASAFTVGFRNNATYARLWEARQLWGGIVNVSRAWGTMARDLVGAGVPAEAWAARPAADDDARVLVHRHIAWSTALRYQLREPRGWENMDRPDYRSFQERTYAIPERDGGLPAELRRLLGDAEAERVLARANKATAVLALQSAHLRALAGAGALDPNRHVALAQQLAELFDLQGGCERIKNFPYPRQFATLSFWFVRLFVVLVPFGMAQEFRHLDGAAVWLAVPLSVVVTWLFLALDKVGESTENPFEGNANDVPVTGLSRTIEIDLRQMLGEADVPAPLAPVREVLM